MNDSELNIANASFAIGYALLVMFGFCYAASGLIGLYKKEKKEDKKNDPKRTSGK